MTQRMPMNSPNGWTFYKENKSAGKWMPNRGPLYVTCLCTRRFNIKSVRACPYCGAEYNSRVMRKVRARVNGG